MPLPAPERRDLQRYWGHLQKEKIAPQTRRNRKPRKRSVRKEASSVASCKPQRARRELILCSEHGPIFCRRKKFGVKIGSCALTFGPIKYRSDFFSELLTTKYWSMCADISPIKNRSDLACHCHTQKLR